ncbi:MAG TPA: hypothetical protein VGG54_13890 [Trebonia sp.]|jgi:hypothetical protein
MPEEVLAKGRRARRARTAKIASTAFGAVAVGILAVAVLVPAIGPGHAGAAHLGAVANSTHPGRPVTKPAAKPDPQTAPVGGGTPASAAVMLTSASPLVHIPQPPGPKAPTTAAAVLDELLKLLPPGITSNYALYQDQYQTGAQVYLDGAAGPGMIRIFLYNKSLNMDACNSSDASDFTRVCGTMPGGAPEIITKIPGNCVEALSIDVDHGGGTAVQIDVPTCLAWNGQTNPPTEMAITAAQAEQIAANPAWGQRR